MHFRELLGAALLTGLLVGNAQACSKHSDVTATAVTPRTAKQAALVSWKPRAWAPPAAFQHARIATASAGMRVERDPVDGTLSMPQPDRSEQLVEVGERTPVSVTRMSNGRVRAQLDESFAEFAVVRIGPDGKPRWTCVSGPSGAERFLKTPSVPAAAPGTQWEDK
jgi:hypothetical protein